MRLEVFCKDRMGLTRELLDLLVLRNIDLRGIEIAAAGRIYLHVDSLRVEDFRALMADIRRTQGVSDVRTVSFMPSEREHRALKALLESMPEAVLSVDLKGRVEMMNAAALTLFGQTADKVSQLNINQLIGRYAFNRWLEQGAKSETERVVVRGRDFLLEVTPVYLNDESGDSIASGALIMLKSTARMGHQLQNLSANDDRVFDTVVAVSPTMRQVMERARKLAPLDAPLLIVGETGTGKDMLARACHLRSHRSAQPFLALNCAALPDDVMESELYGHAPGAYPNALEGKKGFFEQANGGSVLLDEVGEMSPQMQTKLLRFLNDGTFRRVGEEHELHVDVRVICATQKNLLELVQRGQFREDLYYRLNVLTLELPPLRACPEDVMPLVELFVARFADEQGMRHPRIAPEVRQLLPQYGWPGNVRQLKNIIYRALTQLDGDMLTLQDIDLPAFSSALAHSETLLEGSLDDITKRFERSVLTRLYQSYPSTRKLAKRLGVSHTAIANKLREYGLSARKAPGDEESSS
ncbi:transcriptional regulator TyrR [Lonsdalea quercina]|uniref:transcriptional regulator TyrR n=1 Tax=Lonsdalea quercina TaxID=71657 RepID=UPI0039762856